ncbi:DUF4268 domain-containing protein [Hasllibacter sp. MH4015]|uniref:DUF4268 domain-containing protein n=1 Tax=Hasllibacter sp. MH4015 TaxID=2854029 RepID=UPI001CD34821|nr:DUF4268 domain-containing protein [Hasllibacter sp. MH4015]
MTDIALGTLESVDLRAAWQTEAADFTPWLAEEANLKALGDTLSLDLELEAQEKSVGPFRADILCKEIGSDTWVLIENQLERTDHTHLGQLLTYASGLKAVTIIWIAAKFTEEHRATLDWLNTITDASFRFFGIEVELWRIAASPVAPKFNIVAKPNNWSRAVARAATAIDEDALSDVRQTQLAYWEALNTTLSASPGPVAGTRKARPRGWINYSVGRTNFGLGAVMLRQRNAIRAEVYIRGPDAKSYLAILREDAPHIQAELGFPLTYDPLPDRQDARIYTLRENTDPEDRSDWPSQHEWLADKLNQLHRAFAPRIRALDLADMTDDSA